MNCPVCGCTLAPESSLSCGSTHARCPDCAAQVLCAASSHTAYPDDYYGSDTVKFAGFAGQARRFWHTGRARRLAAMVACTGTPSVYDIGCGDGEFLAACRTRGFEVHGCEPMDRPRKQASQRLGCQIDAEAFAHDPTRRYDIITAWQVVEHVADPAALLELAIGHLAPQGVLAVSTVNNDSVQAKLFGANWLHLDPPRHLWVGSRSAVTSLVERSGATVFAVHSNHLEFGPVGYVDSLVNVFDSRRDRLLDCLKHGFSGAANKSLWFAAAALTPLAIALSAVESALGRSATFELYARRHPGDNAPSEQVRRA